MNYLPLLTEDEIRYVCSVIPLQKAVAYFKHYPKDFAKVMPGFRATSLKKQDQVSGILYRGRNQYFISSFIEKHISRWIEDINDAISKKIEEGESKELALVHTLPDCYFVDNIALYFKLTGEEQTEEFLSILSASIKCIKNADIEYERIKKELNTKTTEVSHLEKELECVQVEKSKISQNLSAYLKEIKALKHTNADLKRSNELIASYEQTIESLMQKLNEQTDCIQQLRTDLSNARKEQRQLEKKISEELTKQQEIEKYRQYTVRKPKCPKDIGEFKDYLGYNFENIGVPINSDYYLLLKNYLSMMLFHGKPIIISRNTGLSLMKCVSNTLVNTPVVFTLTFDKDITEKLIDDFLSQDKRIVCLDNFIGNYDETILITMCDKHRDKIIFLTVAYDRTLCFVPAEFMGYCYYLNINRIEAFVNDNELTEDPSVVDEIETVVTLTAPDNRWSVVLKEMLEEFGIRGAVSAYKSALVNDELSLCYMLAFDILPYCTDVLKINPFSFSERLVKYAGDSGRCQYKNLFKRWFA